MSFKRHRQVAPVAENAADAKGPVLDLVLVEPMAAVIGPPRHVESDAGKPQAIRQLIAGREHGGDLWIGVAQGHLEAPHVAVFRGAAEIQERNLHGRHPTPLGIPHHAAVLHRGLPGLVRLADLGQIAVGRKDARCVADDPIHRAFRAALIVPRIDEHFEHVVAEKDRPHLCEAPFGPFRQMGTVPFFRR